MPTKRVPPRFKINPRGSVAEEPEVLKDQSSWCWSLLRNHGAGLHEEVRRGLSPGIGLKGKGTLWARRQLYAACVLHVILTSVEEHRVCPSYQQIANALNAAGVLTWSGKQWRRQEVYQLIARYDLADHLIKHRHVNNLAFTVTASENPKMASRIQHWPS